MNKMFRKLFSVLLAVMMLFSVIPANLTFYKAVEVQASESDSGLLDNACDGVILHCWNWSYNAIKDSMQDIYNAGYTSLQTSPVQRPKEHNQSCTYANWWKVYQPTTLSFAADGESWFGTKAEFKAMCDEAEKYGIKVIVDIVSNHLANNTGGKGNCTDDIFTGNDPTFRDDPSCWHLNGSTYIDYNNQHRNGDTTSLTHGFGGWPDLNTGSKKVQNAVIDLMKECVDLGADGFRFDAAKHIELPTDPGGASDFWPTITSAIRSYGASKGVDLYLYGEILDDGATAISNYTKYIAVTDNRAGNNIRDGVTYNDIGKASSSALYYNGEAADNLVLWAESHDTYANDNYTGPSTKSNQDQINRTWAIVAARDFAALYFIRPSSTSVSMGTKSGNTAWKSTEVAEVNKFHNYFSGQKEYMSSSGNVAIVERGTAGAVLVNIGGGQASVNATANLMAAGTYTDQVSGNKFTVSNGKISGQIGSTGIAVVYNPAPIPKEPTATISKEGGNFSDDTLSLTIGLKNATSGTYKIGNDTAKTFTSSQTITIGSGMAYGESVTVTLTATDGTKTTTGKYTFTKVEQSSYVAYLEKPSGWGDTVYCYAYDDSGATVVKNAEWPGVAMTYRSATGYYKYELPETLENPKIIFNDKSNQYPASQEPGLTFTKSSKMIYKGGSWEAYASETGTVIVKYVDESGKEIASSKTLTGDIGAAYTTTAATIAGYELTGEPSNANGKYTSSTITVKYVYAEKVSTDPIVKTSLASGSTFKTETKTITLTLSNAVSGTYSVDNGPVKTFTGSKEVVLGQGKVADSVVTVKATATSASGTTKNYTFTYNKEFNGTVNEAEDTVTVSKNYSVKELASQGLASQYSTNAVGTGVEKTISIDGNISDWTPEMKIAQGAANDDPRVYRPNSMYEVGIDLYSIYAAYDDNNLYLMWEMTNVQDVVAPNDDYPLTQGTLWQTHELPFFIAVDTGDSSTAIGNKGALQTGGTIWNSGLTFENSFNKLISINTKGGNGPWVYGGDSTGLNPVELLDSKTSNIKMGFGKGILSDNVTGIDGAYGSYNGRVVGDVCNNNAEWVDFNTIGHNSASMDFFYELSIPYDELGITKSDVASKGVGVLLVATMGLSGMDCLPYDTAMNDNADQPDTQSQENNSYEKSDADYITTSFARVGSGVTPPSEDMELNFGADRSAPQLAGTALTLKGIAEGGKAPYTYKYYVNGSSVGTKSGSGETSVAWTPSAAGTYTIKCVVTDAAGDSVTSSKMYTVEGAASTLNVTAKLNNSTPKVGDSVTISASATGGKAPYTYSFLINNPETKEWYRYGNGTFKSANTLTWKAAGTGKRNFFVEVKDSTGKVVRSSAATLTIKSSQAALSVTAKASNANPAVGENITITATGAGGSGNYTYSFLINNPATKEWYRYNKTFKSGNTQTWKAAGTGKRNFYAEVKDSTGKVVRSSAVVVNIKSSSTTALSVKATADIYGVYAGSNVTIKATGAGGSGSYTYSFLINNPETKEWYRYGNGTFKSANTLTWKVAGTGKRNFYAEVKDSTGKVVRSSAVVITVR